MKIAFNWLQDYIKIDDLNQEEVFEKLSDSGLEVEGVELYQNFKGNLEGLVVGEVRSCYKHPNADKLKITEVNIGKEKNLNIICGAPNVEQNQKVVVAPIGTKLYTFQGEPFTIKKSKIRGEISEGMLCAEDEIGLGKGHNGIMVLPEGIKVGSLLSDLYSPYEDTIIEIGITPNRADAISHFGVARDLKALFNRMICFPQKEAWRPHFNSNIQVEIQNNESCLRYSGIEIRNIHVVESDKWLQNRLKSIGLTPINNIVDITNYVMHSIGQPLHAFDSLQIKNQKIVVRNAKENETITTLDGQKRKLKNNHLLICNEEETMAIAGVFGGENSGVSSSTTSIFMESAYFNPISVRKSAKEHGLNTDASFRYERGTDPNITIIALQVAVALLKQSQPKLEYSQVFDHYPQKIKAWNISLDLGKVNLLSGVEIPLEKVTAILTNLDMKVNQIDHENLLVTVPPYRVDVKRDIDLIEEILRIFGFNKVPIINRNIQSLVSMPNQNRFLTKEKIANYLTNLGFYEIMTNSMESDTYYEKNLQKNLVKMLNPLSSNTAVLRNSLLHTALQSIAYNKNRQQNNLKFFEFGKIYWKENDVFKEQNQLIMICTGVQKTRHWRNDTNKADAYYLAGVIKNVGKKMGIDLKEENLLRQVHIVDQKTLKKHDIKDEVFYYQCNWDSWLRETEKYKINIQKISKFPKVTRDLALVVDASCSYFKLKEEAHRLLPQQLEKVSLFDVYSGKSLTNDKQSLGLSFTLHNPSKTMEEKEIEEIMDKLIHMFKQKFHADIRQ